MSALIVNQLRLLRNACAALRDEHRLHGSSIDHVISILAVMIVDNSSGADLKNKKKAALDAFGYQDVDGDRQLGGVIDTRLQSSDEALLKAEERFRTLTGLGRGTVAS